MEKEFNKANLEMLNHFKDSVLKQDEDDNCTDANHAIIKRDYSAMTYVSCLILLTNLFWLIVMKGFQNNIWSSLGFIGTILLVTSSIAMCFLSIKNVGSIKFKHYAILTYYIVILVSTTCLTISTNYSLSLRNITTAYGQISLCAFYIFLYLVFPLPYKKDYIIIATVLIVSYFLPSITPGKECYSLLSYGLLYMFLASGYIYFGLMYRRLFKNEIEVKHLNQCLLEYSYVDMLTETLNRRSLDAFIESEVKGSDTNTIGVVFFDIDNFKEYNDTYSHVEGDKILKDVCSTVIAGTNNEGYLFRYGGEEFIYLITNVTSEELLKKAINIKNLVYDSDIERNDISNSDRITISVGCSIFTKEEMLTDDYVAMVDKQLYIGKNNKKNCVVFNDRIYS